MKQYKSLLIFLPTHNKQQRLPIPFLKQNLALQQIMTNNPEMFFFRNLLLNACICINIYIKKKYTESDK